MCCNITNKQQQEKRKKNKNKTKTKTKDKHNTKYGSQNIARIILMEL